MNSAQLFKGGSENSSRQNYNTSERRLSNNEVIYDYRPKEEKKKEFLKKGTNLNKQILTNLMRKKLSRDVVDP